MWNNLLNYLTKLITSFDDFLAIENASKQTRKNYKSDLTAFFSWFCEASQSASSSPRTDSPKEALRLITTESIEAFKRWLKIAHAPPATINRRLSALRAFFRFTTLNGWTQQNPAQYVANIPMPKNEAKTPGNITRKALPEVHMLPAVLELPAHKKVAPVIPVPIPVVGGGATGPVPMTSPFVAGTGSTPDTFIVPPTSPAAPIAAAAKGNFMKMFLSPYGLAALLLLLLLASGFVFLQITGLGETTAPPQAQQPSGQTPPIGGNNAGIPSSPPKRGGLWGTGAKGGKRGGGATVVSF